VAQRFRFRLEQVLDHRLRREDLMRQELAQAMHAVAAQQERAVAAEEAVRAGLALLRSLMESPTGVVELQVGHQDLALARARAAHEWSTVAQLEAVADERRAAMVRASQDREALSQLREKARVRHEAEWLRREGAELDELALRRAARARAGLAA
jgi:flagellar export protein FliJ